MTGATRSTDYQLGGRLLVALTTWALPRMMLYSLTGVFFYNLAELMGVVPVASAKDGDWWRFANQWALRGLAIVLMVLSLLTLLGGVGAGLIAFPVGLVLALMAFIPAHYWKREVAQGRSGQPPTPTSFFVERVRRGRRRGVERGWISTETAHSPLAAWPTARAEFRELVTAGGL